MRKRTIRSGLRLLILSLFLLLFGTFYAQQINALLAVADGGAAEFVKLSFFWSGVLGAAAIIMVSFGLLQRSHAGDTSRLLPSLLLILILLATFFTLFYQSVTAPPQERPLRPGESVII
jgi:glucan phosphoethanolaminetransferase (alkaline phosphatase superfamily)